MFKFKKIYKLWSAVKQNTNNRKEVNDMIVLGIFYMETDKVYHKIKCLLD